MMTMTIDPGTRIDINAGDSVDHADSVNKPDLEFDSTMGDTHMQDMRDIKPGYKPNETQVKSPKKRASASAPALWRKRRGRRDVCRNQ